MLYGPEFYSDTQINMSHSVEVVVKLMRAHINFASVLDIGCVQGDWLAGDHSYEAVSRDIVGARRLGATVISGHDYTLTCPGVVQAVEMHFPGATRRCDTAWIWGLH